MRHYENVVYPVGCKAVIDVTKAPYFVDNTGVEDCTEKICKIIDDVLLPRVEIMEEVYERLKNSPDGTEFPGNNRKVDGRIYALGTYYMVQVPTLYFPNGTYLATDTISYGLKNLHNMMYFQTSGGHEMNACIRFMGQSREKTIIKLKDNCKGFEYGQERPVINFMQGERSNVSYSNYFENITVDVGAGNPGAVGLAFFANNNGAVRNVTTKGFWKSVNRDWRDELLPDGHIDEYLNIPGMSLFGDEVKSLNLPVPPVPDLPRNPLEEWCCVNDFGAVGDGATDDTAAIQAAFNSGKKVVWFQPGRYILSESIHIPASVEHVHFMFCDIAATHELSHREEGGIFVIEGECETLLLIEKLLAWYECIGTTRMFCHNSKRTVFMRDVHSQAVGMYYNTVPGGEVFFQNAACTVGNKLKYGNTPCFFFDHQTAWCHAINPERSYNEVVGQHKIDALGNIYLLRVKTDGLYSASIYERFQCLCGKHTDTQTACAVCGSPALSFMPWPYEDTTKATQVDSAVAVGHNSTGNASLEVRGGTIRNGNVYRYPGSGVEVSAGATVESLVLN